MKIDTAQQNYIAALGSAHKKPVTKQTEESLQLPESEQAAFSVRLSAQAQQPNEPEKIVEEARQDKIDAIREQLASGTYSISGKDVAKKILSFIKG